ncbi:MAG: tRNA (adenosine(37)-N6)-threonylcarbamoyltransferase complex dimerization subunit type 1 TsaB [Ferruginibacter sp.]
MSIIVHIDTASSFAAVSISKEGKLLQYIGNENQQEHAAFLQPAIQQLLKDQQLTFQDIDAVAVVIGPGSYTGLRVGLASAKGICYALKKPLIAISTLQLMAAAALQVAITQHDTIPLLCPIIDARRMEVFTAVYNEALETVVAAKAMLLNNDSFVDILLQNKVLFFGSGAPKLKLLTKHINALFTTDYNSIDAMCALSFKQFLNQQFAELAYCEPLYLKEFFSGN